MLHGYFLDNKSHMNSPRLDSKPLDKNTAPNILSCDTIIMFLPEVLIFQKQLRSEPSLWQDFPPAQYSWSL
jgi:hypothetical protein